MIFAKTNGISLVKYPYTWADLRAENPFTAYDDRFDLNGWYQLTEEGISTGNTILPVRLLEEPEYDPNTQYIVQDLIPRLIDDEWVLGWTVNTHDPSPVEGL